MKKILSWILTPIFILAFCSLMFVFHPLIAGSRYLGPGRYRRVVEAGNGCLLWILRLVGTRISIRGLEDVPRNQQIIFVSNHQGLYDIPLILWTLRDFRPQFIAKKELGRGIPSLSHALRNMGACLIDRKSRSAAVKSIRSFAATIRQSKDAPIIFPEGTRSRGRSLGKFRQAGLSTLLEELPGATLVPITIDGTWQYPVPLVYPVPLGKVITFTIGKPIIAGVEESTDSILAQLEASIRSGLGQGES